MTKKWTPEIIQQVLEMQKKGLKTKFIANFFNVTTNSIYKMLSKYIYNYKTKIKIIQEYINLSQIKYKKQLYNNKYDYLLHINKNRIKKNFNSLKLIQ